MTTTTTAAATSNNNNHFEQQQPQQQHPSEAGRRVVAEGLSSHHALLIRGEACSEAGVSHSAQRRSLSGPFGETRSRPRVTVAGGPEPSRLAVRRSWAGGRRAGGGGSNLPKFFKCHDTEDVELIDFLAVVRKEAEVRDCLLGFLCATALVAALAPVWVICDREAARGVPRSHLHHDGVGEEGVGRPSDKTVKGLVSELDVGAGDQGIIFGYACVRATCLWRTRGQHVWKVCLACARMVFSGGCCQTAVRSKKVAGHSGLER